MKRIRFFLGNAIVIFALVMVFGREAKAVSISWLDYFQKTQITAVPTVNYQTHIQDIGWMGNVSHGETAGTIGQAKRMEAIKINLKTKLNQSMITYRTHVQDIGWQDWVKSGEIAGTTGQAKAIEAIQIKLTGSYAKKYDVYYRVHVKNKGWLGWARNGKTAGSEGLALRVEAIEIKLVTKGQLFETGGSAELKKPKLTYEVQVQEFGWLKSVEEANIAGTTGLSKRLEAMKICLKDFDGNNGIRYRTHVSNIGWQDYKKTGEIAGDTSSVEAIEAVQIELSESLKAYFDIQYRVYTRGLGWLEWVSNGEVAGTTGQGLQAEALEIKLVNRKEGKLIDINWSHIEAVGNQASRKWNGYKWVSSDSCGCFAMAYCKTIIDKTVHNWNEFNANSGNDQYDACASWYSAGYQLAYSMSEAEIYRKAYESINNNRPFVIYVNGPRSNTHYITIVGYENISSVDNLSAGNFLIIDSCPGVIKTGPENMEAVGYSLKILNGGNYQYIY